MASNQRRRRIQNVSSLLAIFAVLFLTHSTQSASIEKKLNNDGSHQHSYQFNFDEIFKPPSIDTTQDSNDEQTSPNSSFKIKFASASNNNLNRTDCASLFPICMCSLQEETQRHFLYCNDPALKRIPDFKSIYAQFDRLSTNRTLIFSKIDFSRSGIKRIRKGDFNCLKLDLLNPNMLEADLSQAETQPSSTSFENYVEHLKKTIMPTYHLEFDSIQEIDDGSFEELIPNSMKLTYRLSEMPLISKFNLTNTRSSGFNENLLKVKFSKSRFNFAPNRKPFVGLKAREFHVNEMANEYLANSIFDESSISELFIEDSLNFVGFVDLGNSLPNGRLLHRFIAVRSYKIDALCSHSLPSFVEQETFTEIIVKKCPNLSIIKEFTFYKYPHLKSLLLSSNNFSKLEKNCFRYLSQLETLDLSSNPITTLDDFIFKDLSSLKRLFIESTQIRAINDYTMSGLVSLRELRLSKSHQLSRIEGKAFADCRPTLKELHLKDTQIRLMESVEQDRLAAPFPKHPNGTWVNSMQEKFRKPVWFDGLELDLLNLDSSLNSNEQLSLVNLSFNKRHSLICKIHRYLSPNTLLHLQRNHTCNCLIYLIYQKKNFPKFSNWEFKAPYCYRAEFKANASSTMKREVECGLNSLASSCFPTFTTTTTMKSTTTKRARSTSTRPPELKFATPSASESKQKKLPKLDFQKLAKVIATIIAISIVSVLITIVVYRRMNKCQRKKKEAKSAKPNKMSSNSSSTQTTLNTLGMLSGNKAKKKVLMPPSVIPPFNPKLNLNTKNTPSTAAIHHLVSNQARNEAAANSQPNLSRTYDSKRAFNIEKNLNEAALLLMQGLNTGTAQAPSTSFNLNE